MNNALKRKFWRWLHHRFYSLHRWQTDQAKRYCHECGAEEWLMENRFPEVGEPKYFWKDMTWPGL